jgi:thiol-disulfide isomerase/thioredoxin
MAKKNKIKLSSILALLGVIALVYGFSVISQLSWRTELNKALLHKKAPNFQLHSILGTSQSLYDFKPKLLILHFWASWCDSCMDELPSLIKFQDKYLESNIQVIGINIDERPELVVPRLNQKLGITFLNFKDPENILAEFFNVHGIPVSIVLNAHKEILMILPGAVPWDDQSFQQRIEAWVK